MFPARRRGRRTGGSTVAPRTVVTAGRTGQVGQVWVSCWILLSATCILSARAQGKMRNSENDFFLSLSSSLLLGAHEKKKSLTENKNCSNAPLVKLGSVMAQSLTLRPKSVDLCVCVSPPTHSLSTHSKKKNPWTLMYGDKCWLV